MTGFKLPTFDERAAASKAAKLEALAKLRKSISTAEPASLEKSATPSPREIAAAERRAAHRAAIEQEKAARAEARAKAEAAAAEQPAKAAAPKPTAEELKAARDARYAARKRRQRG